GLAGGEREIAAIEIGGAGGIARLDAALRRFADTALGLGAKLGLASFEVPLALGERRLARLERRDLGQCSLRALALTGSLLLESSGGRPELLVLRLERTLALLELPCPGFAIRRPR